MYREYLQWKWVDDYYQEMMDRPFEPAPNMLIIFNRLDQLLSSRKYHDKCAKLLYAIKLHD